MATDLVRGGRVLKGIGAEAAAATRYRAVSAASLRASVRAAAAGNVLEAANVLAGGLLLALVALVGGRLAASGDISVGELVAAVGLTQFLIGPLQRVAWAAGMFAGARASADRAAAVLAAPAGGRGRRARRAGGSAGSARAGPRGHPLVEVAAGEHVGLVSPTPPRRPPLLRRARAPQRRTRDEFLDGLALGDVRAQRSAHRARARGRP